MKNKYLCINDFLLCIDDSLHLCMILLQFLLYRYQPEMTLHTSPCSYIQNTGERMTSMSGAHLLMTLFIWLSFSSCCRRSRSSLSSSRDLYSINSFCICCSCTKRRLSYSSRRRLEIFSRSLSLAISCSY